jgi:hypothetical protein
VFKVTTTGIDEAATDIPSASLTLLDGALIVEQLSEI